MAISESYPDLKANASFIDLQRQLKDMEGENRQRPQVLQRRGQGFQHPYGNDSEQSGRDDLRLQKNAAVCR